MGAWGTGISSNDTYADVFAEFFDLYDEGMDVHEIAARLVAANQETIHDPDDSNNFWFAMAKAKWECKQLDAQLLKRVRGIIESGSDLKVWRGLDASESDLRKRDRLLNAFLEKLCSEKPKARARKKKVIRQAVFEKGDCLSFRLENGNYGGAVVLEASANVGFGLNLLAATRINQTAKPTTMDFEKAEILVVNYASFEDHPSMGWNYSTDFKKDKHVFEFIGQIEIIQQFDAHDYTSRRTYGYRGGWKIWIIDVTNLQFNSEREKPRPKTKIWVKDFMKRRRWFW